MRKFLAALLSLLALAPQLAAGDAALAFQTRVEPVLKSYCVDCHGPKKQKGKVNLADAHSLADLTAKPEMWFRALEQVEAGEMPPDDEKQPTAAERAQLVSWVRGEYTQALLTQQRAVGRAQLRRLSRNEYAHTIEDLFGFRPAVEKYLPSDGTVGGYDKVSTSLPLSAEGALGYLRMAEDLQKWMFLPPPKPVESGDPLAARTVRVKARESGQSKGHLLVLEDGWIVSFNSDTNSGNLWPGANARVPGVHKIRLSVYAYQTDQPLAFGIYTGNTFDLARVLEAPPGKPTVLETDVLLKVGESIRPLPFGLGVPVPKNADASKCTKPGLALQWVEIIPPETPFRGDALLTADFPTELAGELQRTKRIVIAKDAKVAKGISRDEFLRVMRATFTRLAPRFFRRDATSAEVAQWVDEIARRLDSGTPAEAAFFSQITELLLAPDFLCLVETPGPLNDFALASRLSYFLWNSTPDDALLEVARQGRLRDPRVLREQTERLLAHAKSARFVNDFADQWLGLRAIADTTPDGKLYPEYDELIRFSSVRETQTFLREMVAQNLGVAQLVAAPWTLLNAPLAKHYGLPPVTGVGLQKVSLPAGSPYGGVWTQAAVMKVTANGTNTSPIKRGVWFADRLLGLHIAAPPSDVMPLEPDIRGATTLREQLELHRKDASCAGCHAKFDPFGFALESFDVGGAFRTSYRTLDGKKWKDGLPVDPSGKTPGGTDFKDIHGLRQHIVKTPLALAYGLTSHLVTYATGAPVTALDQPAIAAIAQSTARDGHGFRSLIHAVVQSELFRYK